MTKKEIKPEQKKAAKSKSSAKEVSEGASKGASKNVKPRQSAVGGKRSPSRRVVPWAAAAILIAAFAVLFISRQSDPVQGVASGPTLGGPFTLIDSNGLTVSDTDFRGKFMLIYFGYTFCPDVCPTALTAMAETLDRLGEDGDIVTPLFITIDPDWDTSEHLKEYISFFHPRQVALTGTANQIAVVAKSYGVFYAKNPSADDGHDHDHDDYDMTHSSIIFLMGPDGKYRTHFRHGDSAQDMADRIRKFL